MIVDPPEVLVGRYRIDEPLGAGGMGTVYRGHDLRLDRAVAIKVLRRDLARDPSLRRRFEREARSAARVTHPHAVAVYDTGEDTSLDTFIVMELLSGRTLVHELADGPMDETRLREIADDVLDALGAAHAQGIVHRDVKPGNILLTDDGTVKVGDFGIATSLDAGETTTVVPLGTPAYAAPERLRGLMATERSDLYSFGVVLYEAAAGVRPYTGSGTGQVADAVVGGTHVPLGERRPDLSPAFVDAVERSLALDPADRFATAAEMRAAMSASTAAVTVPLTIATETAVLPTPHRVPALEARRTFGARRAAAAVVLALVLVILVALVLVIGSDGDTPSTAPESTTAPVSASGRSVAPVTAVPLPEPLARAVKRLERATQP